MKMEWSGKPPKDPEILKVHVNKDEPVKVEAPKQDALKVKVTK